MSNSKKYLFIIINVLLCLVLLSACGTKQGRQSDRASNIVKTAHKYVGVPYVYGGKSPKGFDCSGLVLYVYKQHGIKLPAGSWKQATIGKTIKKRELQPSDLIFFKTSKGSRINHVGIYIGGGNMIHAPGRGKRVLIADIHSSYFKKTYATSRRIIFD